MLRYVGAVALSALCLAAVAPASHAQEMAKLNYAAMQKLGWKLSAQAYTFREMSLFETIDTLHKLGIRYVELYPGQRLSKENPMGFDSNAPADVVDQVIAKLKSANVTPVAYGVCGLDNNEAGDRKVFDFAKKLGLLNIVAEPPEDSFEVIDKLCQEYKINVAIHDHPQPSHYWNPDTVLKVCEGRSKRIGSCADTGHWYRSGLVPVDCLKKLEGRIIEFHFKDLVINDRGEKVDAPWGTGVCDARAMLEEVKRQGIHPVFSIEYESTTGEELVSNVAKCCAWFSKTAAEIAKQ